MNKSAEKRRSRSQKKKLSLWKVRKKIHQVGQFADFQRQLDELEEEIYRRFMSRQLEDTDGNQAVPKITIEKDS